MRKRRETIAEWMAWDGVNAPLPATKGSTEGKDKGSE